MTGEMSNADLTSDGEWGLIVDTAEMIDGAELRPFDKYQGPYMLYKGHKLWFVEENIEGFDIHGIREEDDPLGQLHVIPERYDEIAPKELAQFIIERFE